MRNICKRRYGATLAILAAMISGAQAEECRLVEIASLDAQWDGGGGLVIPATIDDQPKYLLVDTGGIYNMLTTATIDELHLFRQALGADRPMLMGVDAAPLTKMVIAHSVKLGNLSASRVPFVEMPPGHMADNNAGTLGPVVLANYDVEIDPANRKLNLFSQNHCPGKVIYWTRDKVAVVPMTIDRWSHISVPVTLDGRPVDAVIDTGSGVSWVVYGNADVFPKDQPAKEPESRGYLYPFKTLSFDGVEVVNPKVGVVPNHYNSDYDVAPMILGMTILHQLHMFISYGEHKLYVTAADAH